MKLKKLDKRHKGHGQFKYMASFTQREKEKFCQVRNWCWQQWGPGCEIDFYPNVTSRSYEWSWVSEQYRMNIYIATDKEYQWFLLKWHD
jgi:hypothetical protein